MNGDMAQVFIMFLNISKSKYLQVSFTGIYRGTCLVYLYVLVGTYVNQKKIVVLLYCTTITYRALVCTGTE